MSEDVCENNHKGNPESVAAHKGTDKNRDQARVLASIAGAGPQGRTCDEVEALLSMSHQTASARCSDLKKQGLVQVSAARRKTRSGSSAAVLVVKS